MFLAQKARHLEASVIWTRLSINREQVGIPTVDLLERIARNFEAIGCASFPFGIGDLGNTFGHRKWRSLGRSRSRAKLGSSQNYLGDLLVKKAAAGGPLDFNCDLIVRLPETNSKLEAVIGLRFSESLRIIRPHERLC